LFVLYPTDDDIIHDDAEKSEMFNDFFCDQSNINDDYLIPPDLDGPAFPVVSV
jgi:hypothetical protein